MLRTSSLARIAEHRNQAGSRGDETSADWFERAWVNDDGSEVAFVRREVAAHRAFRGGWSAVRLKKPPREESLKRF